MSGMILAIVVCCSIAGSLLFLGLRSSGAQARRIDPYELRSRK